MPFVSMGCCLKHEGFAQTRSNEKNEGTRRLISVLNPGGNEITASGQIVPTILQPSLNGYAAFLITEVNTKDHNFVIHLDVRRRNELVADHSQILRLYHNCAFTGPASTTRTA